MMRQSLEDIKKTYMENRDKTRKEMGEIRSNLLEI